jgi:hypothetical protein
VQAPEVARPRSAGARKRARHGNLATPGGAPLPPPASPRLRRSADRRPRCQLRTAVGFAWERARRTRVGPCRRSDPAPSRSEIARVVTPFSSQSRPSTHRGQCCGWVGGGWRVPGCRSESFPALGRSYGCSCLVGRRLREVSVVLLIVAVLVVAVLACSCALVLRRRGRARG